MKKLQLILLLTFFLFALSNGCNTDTGNITGVKKQGIAAGKKNNGFIIEVKTIDGVQTHYSSSIIIHPISANFWVINVVDEGIEVALDNSIIENIGITQ